MFKFIRNALRAWFDGFTTTGKFWLGLGLGALIVDAAISYQYGITLTLLHGLGFALVAVFFALLPDASYSEIEAKRIGSGVALGLLCVPLGAVAFYSHLGYGAGVRLGDMQQTAVQNAKYEDKGDTKVTLDAEVKRLEQRRDNLDAELTKLVETKVGDWAVAVKPSSAAELDGRIEAKQLEVANESKRGGCKSRCELRTNELAHLTALRAKALEIEHNDAKHRETVAKLSTVRDEAANVEYKSSPVVNQNNVAAQLWLAFTGAAPEKAIEPDAVTSSFTSILIAGGGSLAFMIMAPVGFFVAGRNRRPVEELPVPLRREAHREDFRTSAPVFERAPVKPSTTVVRVDDDRALKLIAGLKTMLDRPRSAAA